MARDLQLVPETTIGAAVTFIGGVHNLPEKVSSLSVQAVFVRAAGGTDVDVYVQTTIDGGATWIDIIQFHFLTTTATKISSVREATAVAAAIVPTDGTLGNDTIVDGVLGDRLRVKVQTTGTYTGATTIEVTATYG
jgi:hypothetical protein